MFFAKPACKLFPFSSFTNFASRASGYPLLQKPHFQIMTIYNSFIIFLIGFLPLVGEFLPQTPNKNRRENLKIFSPSGARWAYISLCFFNIYEPFSKFAGAGATVPLLGFGNLLWKGVKEAVNQEGFIGVFLGGLKASAVGISAALIFGYLASLIFEPKMKK